MKRKELIQMEKDNKEHVFCFQTEIKSINDNLIEGHIATSDKDIYNDVLTSACMDDIVSQLQSKKITIDVEHASFTGKKKGSRYNSLIPVAKINKALRDSKGIFVRSILNPASEKFEEVKSSVKNGFLNSFSIAYIPIEVASRLIDGQRVRFLNKVNLLNVTYTGIPANDKASFSNVALKSICSIDDNIIDVDENNTVKNTVKENTGGIIMTDTINNDNIEQKQEVVQEVKQEQETTTINTKDNIVTNQNNPINNNTEELKNMVTELKNKFEQINTMNKMLKEHEKILQKVQLKSKIQPENKNIKQFNISPLSLL